MTDVTNQISTLLTAARSRDLPFAQRMRDSLETTLRTRPEYVSPIDEVRARLAFAEHELYREQPQAAEAILMALENDTRLSLIAREQRDFYVLQAAALGQQYKAVRSQTDGPAVQRKAQLVQSAMQAISHAQAAGQGRWLQYLATDRANDDLAAIATDNPTVKRLLGLG